MTYIIEGNTVKKITEEIIDLTELDAQIRKYELTIASQVLYVAPEGSPDFVIEAIWKMNEPILAVRLMAEDKLSSLIALREEINASAN